MPSEVDILPTNNQLKRPVEEGRVQCSAFRDFFIDREETNPRISLNREIDHNSFTEGENDTSTDPCDLFIAMLHKVLLFCINVIYRKLIFIYY